jgi:C4-dicarboxylate transporter DctQ subunit
VCLSGPADDRPAEKTGPAEWDPTFKGCPNGGMLEEMKMGNGDRSIFGWVCSLSDFVAGIAFAALCISVGIQVAARYIFSVSFGWAEEFPLFVFLWVCFLAAASAYRQNSHLGVSLVFDRLPKGFRKVARYIELLLTFGFSQSSSITNRTWPVRSLQLRRPEISQVLLFHRYPISAVIFMILVIEKIIVQVKIDFGRSETGSTDVSAKKA